MRFVYGRQDMTSLARAEENCWLLANGLGGYASTTAAFSVTRADQGLLVAVLRAPNLRRNLVRRLSERVLVGEKAFFLSTQSFADKDAGAERKARPASTEERPAVADAPAEDGYLNLSAFVWDGVPKWTYEMDGVRVTRECCMRYGGNVTAVLYTVENRSGARCTLRVTPVLAFSPAARSIRLQSSSGYARAAIRTENATLHIRSDGELARIARQKELLFFKDDERDGRESTGTGELCCAAQWTVTPGQTRRMELVLSTAPCAEPGEELLREAKARRRELLERSAFKDEIARELARSADAYIVDRASTGGKSIIAGYPLFGDWGRDTMIALPGCVLATKRYDTARSILRTFLAYERDGLIPNLFPEGEEEPRYNTADAALLLINCVWLYHKATGDGAFVREAWPVLERIVSAYRSGTRHAISMDTDGLIRAGEGLDQVTWMDVCVDGILPTPRHGKPVEINAYWYNALCVMGHLAPMIGADAGDYLALAKRVRESFVREFWLEDRGYLRDVLSGTAADEQLRCNQIWAVTMPFAMLAPEQERRLVDTVYRHLYTPCGLRTLSPEDAQFRPAYGGSLLERDLAYHQGTVWAYPLGAYYLAYLKVHGYSREAAASVREQLEPLCAVLREGCVGQIPEIYDGLNPGASRGCYAQAWSVGELLRVYEALEAIENTWEDR